MPGPGFLNIISHQKESEFLKNVASKPGAEIPLAKLKGRFANDKFF